MKTFFPFKISDLIEPYYLNIGQVTDCAYFEYKYKQNDLKSHKNGSWNTPSPF